MPEKSGEVIIGVRARRKIGAKVGSEVRLIIPFTEESEAGASASQGRQGESRRNRRNGPLRIRLAVHLCAARGRSGALEQPGRVTTFKIKLKPGADTRLGFGSPGGSLRLSFPRQGLDADEQEYLLRDPPREGRDRDHLAAIVIVAAFNVVSTLMMMIHDKTKEIAILKAMGFAGAGFQAFLPDRPRDGTGRNVLRRGLGSAWIGFSTRRI